MLELVYLTILSFQHNGDLGIRVEYEDLSARCHKEYYISHNRSVYLLELSKLMLPSAMLQLAASGMGNIWKSSEISLTLKLRIYQVAVCSVVMYRSEAWIWNEALEKKLKC